MLEKLPHAAGAALSGLRAGPEKAAFHAALADLPAGVRLTSPAFADGGALPVETSADGPGRSPPLAWSGLPEGTARVAILVEDADSPTPEPLVHLIAWNLPADPASLPEGALDAGSRHDLGRNSFLKDAWLPPDPPTGHGPHRYLFQIYALGRALDLPASPGRGAFLDALRGRALAKGLLTGTYERR